MELTNRHNLPETIHRVVLKDPYSKGEADFSVTELIDSPQIAYLKAKHDDEVTEDLSDLVMSILGTAIHHILEQGAGPDDIVERRFR